MGPLKRLWKKTAEGVTEAVKGTKAWAARHPALSGAVAGAAAGTTLFPGIGTIGGAIAGAGLGATIGGDERNEEDQERETLEWNQKQAAEERKGKKTETTNETPPTGAGVY